MRLRSATAAVRSREAASASPRNSSRAAISESRSARSAWTSSRTRALSASRRSTASCDRADERSAPARRRRSCVSDPMSMALGAPSSVASSPNASRSSSSQPSGRVSHSHPTRPVSRSFESAATRARSSRSWSSTTTTVSTATGGMCRNFSTWANAGGAGTGGRARTPARTTASVRSTTGRSRSRGTLSSLSLRPRRLGPPPTNRCRTSDTRPSRWSRRVPARPRR
ncbi:unannotated protein [freshwater metagenome]|uniref:Unannotated protein n=1 Tax=freshwater metagenome TaxID=449393 RepID=A0A6J7RC49_9ZZZZ